MPVKQPKKAAKKAAKAPAKKVAPKKAVRAKPKAVVHLKPPVKVKPIDLAGHHATKEEYARHLSEAEHAHQDPRWAQEKPGDQWQKAHVDPRLDQGAIKNRRVPRMDKISNWFRQAPKPKA